MATLASELRAKKIIDADVEISDFLKANNISASAMIYEMHFDKKVFKSEYEVREWMKYNYYYTDMIEETESEYFVKTLSPSQLRMDTAITVELRRGLKVLAADLFMLANGDYLFSAKEEMGTTDFNDVNLDDGLPLVIEVAKVVKGKHPTFGDVEITEEMLESFITNFDNKVVGVDLAINEDHAKNEAFGWFKDLFLSEDKKKVLATVKWNTKGTKALSDGEYRYFSPEYRSNFVHPLTGVSHGPTLMGGALTNYPFLKMDAIVGLNDKEQSTKELNVSEKTISLKDHEDKVVELSSKLNGLEVQLNESKGREVQLSNKVKELETEAQRKTLEAANEKLFNAGKINKAQLVALNEGKSTFEVLALSGDMNLNEKGSAGAATSTVNLSEAEKKFAKDLGLTDEEFAAGNR